MNDKPSVLFVCVHNAGRSQMATAWLRVSHWTWCEACATRSGPGSRPC
ncbi:protein-tyrosine-phosphatase [Micromonospora echinospora]|uniref:Protein-tyrosine-phosphatase n=1 Tax=Micromonospora echinospora TaxID=1877 RepID=A0ABR6M8J8_MICEC|nr:protein-tyrosine-phosphatase [Micromonospora echinospora]